MALDGLIDAGVSSFCFMVAPVKFKGATGCPVRPIAMV
jgi:kynurenine formamidase